MSSLTGKVILVTGATSGLGAVVAALLAARGAKVALTGRREEQGQEVVGKIAAAGGEAIFIKTDVTVRDDVEAMVARTTERFGRLDGAVNNAGVVLAANIPVADWKDDDWFATIDTNLNAVWRSMKFEIPAMLNSGGGSIVNISSIYGLIGSDVGHSAYSASKFGVIGLTQSAAIDYAKQGIRVNAVCPTFFRSEMVTDGDFIAPLIKAHSAMDRLGETEEVAEAVIWLLSSESSFVNGVAMPIDGGPIGRLY